MQYKSTIDTTKPFKYNEGQQKLLYCNEAPTCCPSLHLSFNKAKEKLLARGMSKEDFDGLMGFLRGLARGLIEEELRVITNRRQHNGYEY